jgi:hypothetical protein
MTNLKSLEIWMVQNFADAGIMFSVMSLLLHIGRSYFERILSRLTLRVAADIWWLLYVVLRDTTLFLAVLFGFFHFNLDIMADIKVGLPFVPLGTAVLAVALLLKVFYNSEDLTTAYKISTALVAIGAMLNVIGFTFVMEGPGEEYAVAKTPFWQKMMSLRSDFNPRLATITFYALMPVMTVIVVVACVKAFQLVRADVKHEAVLSAPAPVPDPKGAHNV